MDFNPDTFLDSAVTESNDTKLIPVPVGEYVAVIDSVKARQWQSRNDPSKAGVALDVTWLIDDPAVKQLLDREKVTCKQGIMLDLQDNGGLDMGKGKNVGLGRLREAVDLNANGQPFAPTMLVGRVAKVKVEHRVDGADTFAEIKQVAHI